MANFHIKLSTGEPGKCRAEKGNCPFGSEDQHYGSANEAREAFEKMQESDPYLRPEKLGIWTGDGVYVVREGQGIEDVPNHLKDAYQRSFYQNYGDATKQGETIFHFNTGDGFYPVMSGSTIGAIPKHLHPYYIKAWNQYEESRLEELKPKKQGFLSGLVKKR